MRVWAGLSPRDSRSATVTVVPEGPVIVGRMPMTIRPGEPVWLYGGPFDPEEIEENHVYFDEFKAVVTDIKKKRIEVKVPNSIAGRQTVLVHVKAGGVWSKTLRVFVEDGQQHQHHPEYLR